MCVCEGVVFSFRMHCQRFVSKAYSQAGTMQFSSIDKIEIIKKKPYKKLIGKKHPGPNSISSELTSKKNLNILHERRYLDYKNRICLNSFMTTTHSICVIIHCNILQNGFDTVMIHKFGSKNSKLENC